MTDPDVKRHLEEVCEKFAIVTIDKASSNFAFICTKFYISKLLAGVSPNKYKQVWLNARQLSNRKDSRFQDILNSMGLEGGIGVRAERNSIDLTDIK